MSRSCFMLKVDFHMLDGVVECNPEYADTTGGHTKFSTGTFKLRCHGPSSGMIEDPSYDREKTIKEITEQLRAEMFDHGAIERVVGRLLEDAEEHCRNHRSKERKA